MKSHNEADYAALLLALRGVMKAKAYTYSRLAREVGVSEVTIKRVFSRQQCSMERMIGICDRLGISFLDLAALARREEEVDHFLSPAQESYFSDHPGHFAIFKELHHGADAEKVRRGWNLNSLAFYRVLRALEKLGLLEVLPGNAPRSNVRGNLRVRHRGPFARKILRPQTLAFLDHVDRVVENEDVCLHSAEVELSPGHLAEYVAEIHALGRKYRARAFRDRSLIAPEGLRSVRWLFAFAPYRTNWRKNG